MASPSVTVLGAGNTAFSVAANLTLKGVDITLFEISGFEESLDPIRPSGAILLEGCEERGPARIKCITTDPREAVDASDLLLLIVPAYAHKPFAEVFAPLLRPGQTVVLMPGTLGTLEWARILRESGTEGITLAEVDTAPYVCRRTAPDTATIWGTVTNLGLGVLPATESERVRDQLDPLFPGVTLYPDVMASGLAAMNPVVHPAGVLLNAGRVEYSHGEFYFYEEGVTPSVAKVIMQVDSERRAVAAALGYDLCPADEAFHRAGFGPKGDLWAAINGSYMLTRLRAPGSLDSRWLTEDIPYGLAAWSSVGAQYDVDTPTLRAMVDIGSIVMGFDGWTAGRGVKELGIEGLDREVLKAFLQSGVKT
ncbi:MAG: NAD/NADP octopine/nopaline dehydrogenase family protein [Candidatus Latescibacteria bacterium]|jgi:opine dehydrogenase|nr:NAD/NADP octopine/nopaline dehydrogenase family protein [Candidatus Latescibacterota bacterium]